MRTVVKLRWLILVLWIAAAAGLFLSAPNMEELVREKGQITVPDGYSSTVAAEMMDELQASYGDGGGLSTVLVFHNADGLSADNLSEIEQGLKQLSDAGKEIGVTSVTTHFEMPELEEQMVSEDGTTLLTLITVDPGERTLAETKEALYEAAERISVEHYYTGAWLITEDVLQSSQDGVKRTEVITVVFILVILLLVFRSFVAPLIPLLTVGISYIVSQSVVAYLVEYTDFPLSTFTQIFLVAVLFGIGTDYCILLISRFKEELAHSGDKIEAVIATYKSAGKTVIFSGLAVLVGFSSIGLSAFSLYQSAVAVAVGVAVMLIALLTLVPFFMATLGKAIFWPARGSLEHKQSRVWGAIGSFSLKRPIWTLLILAAVMVPALSVYQQSTSFNSLDEIGDSYDSVKAFNMISAGFGPGDSLPSSVVVKVDQALDTQEGLTVVERVSRELASVDGVKLVRSATRPTGESLEELNVSEQAVTLGDGLGQAEEGLGELSSGLSEAGETLRANAPRLEEAAAGAEQLTAGTIELKEGVLALSAGLQQIEQGLRGGASGIRELKGGLEQARASAEQLAKAGAELAAGYKQIEGGLSQLSDAYQEVSAQQRSLAGGLTSVGQGLGGLAMKYPELAQDTDFLQLQGAVEQLQAGAVQLGEGLNQLNAQLAGVISGLSTANAGLEQVSGGQSALTDGLGAIVQGIAQLEEGILAAANGQSQIIGKLPEMTAGMEQLSAGQQELSAGFAELVGQLGELTSGLDQSVEGLNQVTSGLRSAQDYLTGLSSGSDPEMSGWYMPQEALEAEEFQMALDTYMSADRRMAKFDVVFEGNPYQAETFVKIDELNAAVERGLKGTAFENASFAINGVASMNNDLRNISNEDYSRTMVLMIIGITLILIILLRSIVMPIYLVLSLLLTYYTSSAITELIFVRLLGYDGMTWAVPFFGFVMLMALGIDYSIFLMDRFKEYRHLSPKEGILLAMKNMGTVIMSAAVILGGTFAAMLPSGVTSLFQIATLVLCGLFLYALVMLPLFIPVMVRTFGEANWWPFMRREDEAASAYVPAQPRDVHM